MTYKQFLPLTLLALLAACDLFAPDPTPTPTTISVSAVTPQSGATGVATTTPIVVQLDLQGQDLNVITLTDSSVQLTGPAGPIAANRAATGDTVTITPTEALAGETTYTVTVTDALQTTDAIGVEPFTSTFVTGAATTEPTDPTDPAEPTDPTTPTDPTDPGDGIDGLVMVNASSVPSSSRMVLTRIGDAENPCEGNEDPECNVNRWNNLKTVDTGEIVLRNNGSSTLSLTLSSTSPETYTVTPTNVSLAPGESETAEVVFSGNYSGKGVYEAFIDAEANGERASVTLAGVYMTRPEAGNEPSLSQILKAAGLQTTLGSFRTNTEGSALAGSEVRSRLWQKADASQDVVITEVAAFKTCCYNSQLNATDFELFEPDAVDGNDHFFQLQYDQDYAQTMYPAGTDEASPNQGTTDFAGPFRIQVDRYSTKDLDQSGLIGVRVWPVTGQTNTYIVGQDYALTECGASAEDNPDGLTANCDYQDHVYLVKNIAPYTENGTTP